MRRQLIEKIERRRELKRKIREAVRAARRRKLIEGVVERKDVDRKRRSRLSERLHALRRPRLDESRAIRRPGRLSEAVIARRKARLAEAIARRKARLAEGLGRRRVINGRRTNESLDLDRKLDRKSRVRALLRKRREMEGGRFAESRIERRRRIAEKLEELRARRKAAVLEAENLDFVDDTADLNADLELDTTAAAGTEGEELDVDLLLGESKEVKPDIKQLNESKRFQDLINKYLNEGVIEEAKSDEKKDEEKKDDEKADKKADKKATAKKNIREKIKACKNCKK